MRTTIALVAAALTACAAPRTAAPTGGGASRRSAALRALAREQEPRNFAALRAALADAEPAVRAEAAFALGQSALAELPELSEEPAALAEFRERAAPELFSAASDPDAGVRRAAVEALGKNGGSGAETALLSAATDVDAGTRGEAALALFRLRFLKRVPDYSTSTADALRRLSSDGEAEVRWRALYAFARWPEARAAEALAAAVRDADSRARLFAARGLGKLGLAPDVALLADADPQVRAEAVAAYGAAKAAERLPAAVYSDASAHVRAAAADALGASGRADLAGPLEAMADRDSPMPRGRALLALAKLRGDAEKGRLDAARRDPSWWIRARAYEAAAQLTGGWELLREGLSDPDPRVASAALETLAASKAPFADGELARALNDPKAPLEMLGTAADAAAERKSPELLAPALEALKRSGAAVTAEVRAGLRKAVLASVATTPNRIEAVNEALKAVPTTKDEPRTFRRLKDSPTVVLETEKGTVVMNLDVREAPNHAAAIADSVRRGLYDGTIWHRVVTAFVVQGADPRGSGWGDAGWRLADEIGRIPFARGTVGMPKAGKDTGGCQLFVSLVPTPHLDGRYTAFGRVTEGLEVLDRLEPGDKILKASLR